MGLVITHAFVSAVPDLGEAGIVGPTDWNDNHVVTGTGNVTVYSASAGTDTITASEAATGTLHVFKAGGTNTGAATFNGTAIKQQDGSALAAGMIKSGLYYWLLYDGTNYILITSGSVV